MKHLDVVGAVIVCGGRVLCMQRGEGKNPETSFKYEFPGGKMEPGESAPEALMRELSEELDITAKITEADYFATTTHQYPGFEMTMQCYICRLKSPEFTQKEHIGHVWALPEELLGLDWAPADIPVARKVFEKAREGKMEGKKGASVKVFIPEGLTLMVASKGSLEELSEEDRAAGYRDCVKIHAHLFYGTESEEYLTKLILLSQPFEEVYPCGAEKALAEDAVTAFQGRKTEYQILSEDAQ